jgi:hypothetical protein
VSAFDVGEIEKNRRGVSARRAWLPELAYRINGLEFAAADSRFGPPKVS